MADEKKIRRHREPKPYIGKEERAEKLRATIASNNALGLGTILSIDEVSLLCDKFSRAAVTAMVKSGKLETIGEDCGKGKAYKITYASVARLLG